MNQSNAWHNSQSKALFTAISKLRTEAETAKFFRDLCTLEEIEEMARRWQAVRLLDKGQPYRKIAEKTGLSTTTVTRVAHWLNHGEGGYPLILKRI